MDYQLFEKGNSSQAVAKAAFDDDFAAEKWARGWAEANATTDDYMIERSDRGLSAHLFRTVAGQWFIMRK